MIKRETVIRLIPCLVADQVLISAFYYMFIVHKKITHLKQVLS